MLHRQRDQRGGAAERGTCDDLVVAGEQQSLDTRGLELVVVAAHQRDAGAHLRRQRGLGAEDERLVEMDDVEPVDERELRDERRVAEPEPCVVAVREHAGGIARYAGV
jgi:hypothetical protein